MCRSCVSTEEELVLAIERSRGVVHLCPSTRFVAMRLSRAIGIRQGDFDIAISWCHELDSFRARDVSFLSRWRTFIHNLVENRCGFSLLILISIPGAFVNLKGQCASILFLYFSLSIYIYASHSTDLSLSLVEHSSRNEHKKYFFRVYTLFQRLEHSYKIETRRQPIEHRPDFCADRGSGCAYPFTSTLLARSS